MKIIIRNRIIIEDAPEKVRDVFKKDLTIPNIMYWKMMRMGKVRALYNIKKEFKYYTEKGTTLSIGRGNLNRVINYLNTYKYEYETIDERNDARITRAFKDDIKLRVYQKGDIEGITKYAEGVIRLGTGYGKTIIATKLISANQRKTLVIVPRTHLVRQFMETIEQYSGCRPGIIQGQNYQIRDITVASIQTLVSKPEIALKHANDFGMVIVDECHTAITSKRLAIIQTFNPKYIYGLTATPRRTDQQNKAIHFTFGPVIIDKDMERAKPHVVLINSDVHIPVSDEYAEMITDQIENTDRNQLILDLIEKDVIAGRKILVLTKRVKHYETLHEYAQRHHWVSYVFASKEVAKVRDQLLRELRENKRNFSVIFGTYMMLSTGTDIPALDTLIFAGDLRSDVLQEQSAGRILRLFGDKKNPKIIDVIDNGNPILLNQARARIRFYKKERWI